MEHKATVRAGAIAAFAGAVILLAMFVIGSRAASALAIVGLPGAPEQYARALNAGGSALIQVMALDNIFVVAYTFAFIGAAASFRERAKLPAAAGLVFTGLLAGLDLTENALTVQMARSALAGIPVTPGQIAALGILDQVKFACGAAAVIFIAAGMLIAGSDRPQFTRRVVEVFMLFGAVNALKVILPSSGLVLVVWMLIMLALGGVYLWGAGSQRGQ
jgi:hypothetical protein